MTNILVNSYLRFQQKYPGFAYNSMTVVLKVYSPFDYVFRFLNGTSDQPPLLIRRIVGPINGQERSGAEYLAYIKLLGEVTSSSQVLDIGCGYGLMALYLQNYIKKPGSYTGIDINKRVIEWAQKHFRNKNQDFKFILLDVKNKAYNPNGNYDATNVRLPFKDNSFDFILLKSVFTHMHFDEANNYLKEIKRILRDKGSCLITLFLCNEVQAHLQTRGLNSINFMISDGPTKFSSNISEAAVAYQEQQFLETLRSIGLSVYKLYYGSWSGRQNGLSYQDMLLVTNI